MQKLNRPHSKPTKIHNYSLNQYAEPQHKTTKRIELQFVWVLECMIRPRTKKEEEDWVNVWHFCANIVSDIVWGDHDHWDQLVSPWHVSPSHNVWCVSLDTGPGLGRRTANIPRPQPASLSRSVSQFLFCTNSFHNNSCESLVIVIKCTGN